MKKLLFLSGAVLVLFSVAKVNATEVKPYVGVKLKLVNSSNDVKLTYEDLNAKKSISDNVFGFSLAGGAKFKLEKGAIRTELEVNKNGNAEKDWDCFITKTAYYPWNVEVQTHAFMLNGYYDIDTNSKVTPYVGIGIGLAHVKGTIKNRDSGEKGSISDTNFAYQIGLGVAFDVTDNVAVDVGYRYIDYGNAKKDFDGIKAKLDTANNEFYVGMRYTF